MFDLVAKSKRLVQIVLVIIMLPFAFFGIDFYFRGMDTADQIAKVGDHSISTSEFGNALRERQDQIRQMMQGKVDPEMLNSPAIKNQVADQLVEQQILLANAGEGRMGISDPQLRDIIHDVPAFKDESTGKFSKERYELLLQTRGLNRDVFEARLRRDAIVSRNRDAIAATHFLPKTVITRLSGIRGQQRYVSQNIISPQKYFSQVALQADEAKKYYDTNKTSYTLPERARVEYVVLSQETLTKSIAVSEQDVQKYYEDNIAQFEQPEERRARHILITVDAKASADEKTKAKSKAEALLTQAKANSTGFAELAKTSSQDPGSATEGGDLGFFTKGRMAKAFDDAVFSMKAGDISGPIETQYGYHVIKLEEIKPTQRQPIDAVRAKIQEEFKKNAVGRRYAEKAEQLSNLVYEQSDSLKPAADALGLHIEQSGWITKDRADPALLNNPKLLKLLFSEEAVKNKRNTEAVEVAPATLVAARVVEHIPAARQPFEVVRELIEDQIKSTKAAELAKKEGEDRIAKLRKGETLALEWSAEQPISREKAEGLTPEAAQVVFRADVSKLPAYSTFTGTDGRFVIFRISKAVQPDAANTAQDTELAKQISTLIGREEHGARITALREKLKVVVNKERLEKN